MTAVRIIAVDGPAGSGKSTLGKKLANFLGYLYFDTGVMYRAVACEVLLRNISVEDENAVSQLAGEVQIDIQSPSQNDGRDNDVLIDGRDVTWEIRQPEIDNCVSIVAAYPGVRQALTAQQRRIGLRGNVVMVGRDIGTVVLPEADLKIYLDASIKERAKRRFIEQSNRGDDVSLDSILMSIRERDQIDSTRSTAPLNPDDDAIYLDSDNLSADEVLEKVKVLLTPVSSIRS